MTEENDPEADRSAEIEAADPPVVVCPLCLQPDHEEPAAEPEFAVVCPGGDASDDATDAFIYQMEWHRSKQKIETTDWNEFAEKAQSAFVLRERADGLATDELPPVARVSTSLQADCDARTPGVYASAKTRAEMDAEFDIDVPHLTVKGEVPRPGLVQAFTQDTANPSDYLLYQPDAPDGGTGA